MVAASQRGTDPGVASHAVQCCGRQNISGVPAGIFPGTSDVSFFVAARRIFVISVRHRDGLPACAISDAVRTLLRSSCGGDSGTVDVSVQQGQGSIPDQFRSDGGSRNCDVVLLSFATPD